MNLSPCPACEAVDLEKKTNPAGTYLHCPACAGDFASIDMICTYINLTGEGHGGRTFKRILAESIAQDPESLNPRKCPICRAPIERFAFGDHPLTIADRCDEHGLWLDDGDLEKVVRQVRAEARIAGEDREAAEAGPIRKAAEPRGAAHDDPHPMVCPNCSREYPDTADDVRCRDCNVVMYRA
jgi:Zn-finger nucleic acid-binding protein